MHVVESLFFLVLLSGCSAGSRLLLEWQSTALFFPLLQRMSTCTSFLLPFLFRCKRSSLSLAFHIAFAYIVSPLRTCLCFFSPFYCLTVVSLVFSGTVFFYLLVLLFFCSAVLLVCVNPFPPACFCASCGCTEAVENRWIRSGGKKKGAKACEHLFFSLLCSCLLSLTSKIK